jgi:cytochrome c553
MGAGKARFIKKWRFPTVYQCAACHRTTQQDTTHGRSLLGFFTAQLNRPAPDSAGINQLDWLFAKGVLAGKRQAAWDLSPRWEGIEDKGASLDVRARSYIAANCSGCHGRRGMASAATMGVYFDFDFHTMEPAMEMRNQPVSWSYGLDTLPPFFYPKNDPANPTHLDSLPIIPALVVPWYPEKSALIFRERSRDTVPGNYDPYRNQMPPLGTYEVNAPAVALLEQWVREMGLQAATALGHGPRRSASGTIRLQGRLLTIAPEAGVGNLDVTGGNAAVSMVFLDGRRVELRRLSPGVYELPAGLPKGLYLIRAGTRSLIRSLL